MSSETTGPSGREALAAAGVGCLLAVVMHWPLILRLRSDIPGDLNDPLVQAWQIAWGGHALLHEPLHFFQANIFWPLRNSLAFTEALAGYAPLGIIGSGPRAAVERYNLVFLSTYALTFFGAYLLARELGLRRAGSAVAGVAFAYAPWRLSQDIHLHVLSTGGIPLSLFLLVRGYRRARWRFVLGGWLVAAWQFSLGFTTGLPLAYLLLVLAVIALALWLKSGRRPAFAPSVVRATLAGAAVFGAVVLWLALPYAQVVRDHPEARRSLDEVALYSPPVRAFLVAPDQSLVWKGATRSIRNGVPAPNEMALFPGVAIGVLALFGALGSAYRRRMRLGLALATLALAALSLGLRRNGLPYPYRALYEIAPGWRGIRTPGRLMNLTTLGLALLAGGGAQQAVAAVRRRGDRRRATLGGRAVALVLVLAVLLEGSGFRVNERGSGLLAGPLHPAVPDEPAGLRDAQPPILNLPLDNADSRKWVLWSTDGFPDIVNGRGSFIPLYVSELNTSLAAFPDRRSVKILQDLGVRTVVMHPASAATTQWRDWARRPLAGLALRREDRDGVVLFHVLGTHPLHRRVDRLSPPA